MKKLFILNLMTVLVSVCAGQYSYQDLNSESLTKSFSGTTTDGSGAIIVFGTFNSSITLGGITVTNSTPLNPSGQNQTASFIGKQSGNSFSWLTKIDLMPLPDHSSAAYINSMTTDAAGNILLTGMFWGKIKFDNIILTSTKLGAAYTTDMMIARLSPEGIFLWASALGNPNEDCIGNEMGISVTSDNAGNVYATGKLYDNVIRNTNACNCGSNTPVSSAVIVKFNAAGTKLWDKRFSTFKPSKYNCKGGTYGARVVSDGVNTYTAGQFSGTVKFGSISLNTGNDSIGNTFILKMDPNGNSNWASAVSNSRNVVNGLIMNNGNLYLIGAFGAGTINFGGPTLTSPVAGTGYLARYNLNGACSWATLPGLQSPNGNLISLPNGNIAMLRDYLLKEFSATNGVLLDSTFSANTQNAKIGGYPRLTRTATGYLISLNLQGSYDYGGITISSTQPVGATYFDMILIQYSMAPPIAGRKEFRSESTMNKIKLYPNPATSRIMIQNEANQPLKMIRIYDLTGKLLYQQMLSNSQAVIDVSAFPAGEYFLRTDKTQKTIKFVKQ